MIPSGKFAAHAADLRRLAGQSRHRRLARPAGIDFASNDYLGLAGSQELALAAQTAIERGVPVGSGGSRLLRGNHPEHEELEREAASFFGSEQALYFSSGYAANSALFATLPQRGDLVVYDELIHASAHDGLRLGRAESFSAAHNDANAFADAIRAWRARGGTGRAWIAAESLYSMDGDFAPLDELAKIADRHDAVLLVDEAHATGVFGHEGRGLTFKLEGRENVVTLRTCGKALGTEGALVCAPAIICSFLVNRGRGFIFSTAPSPLMAAVTRASLHLLRRLPHLRTTLLNRVKSAGRLLASRGATVTGSQIIPLILEDDARTMAVARTLQAAGIDVRGIRPPTVPVGTSRLRISVTLNASDDDLIALGDLLGDVLGQNRMLVQCPATS